MFTQKETRLAVEIQNKYKPIITHDMHQMGSGGARIFVPPFDEPYDPNIHPIIAQGIRRSARRWRRRWSRKAREASSSCRATTCGRRRGSTWSTTASRASSPRSPASTSPIRSSSSHGAIGPQDARWNFPLPYRAGDWRLRNIVDYGNTVAFAGMSHVAKYRNEWLENFYRIHADWVNRRTRRTRS